MQKDYSTLKLEEKENGILIVSLNRPEKYNAVNRVMVEELLDLWSTLSHEADVRVVVLRGEGEKGFCQGLDIVEIYGPDFMDGTIMYNFQRDLGKMEILMRQIPQPIICAVHGAAAGAGLCLALASDIRVISTDAKFVAAFINVGIGGADMGSSYFLPRLIGAGRTYDMLLTGRSMKADEAMQLGLASRCVEREQLMDTALEIAQTIAMKEPLVVRLTKEAINQNLDCSGLEAAIHMENRNQAMIILNVWFNGMKS